MPHIGHAYTTVVADGAGPVAPAARRRTSSSSPAPTSTASRWPRAAEEHGLTPQEQADRTSARFREAWDAAEHQQRRLHPHHRAPPPRRGAGAAAAAKDNGYIYKDTYEGLYCVACEAYYTEDDLVDGNCPIHQPPGRAPQRGELVLRACPPSSSRLLDWYEAHPDFVGPEGKRNEALGLIRQGLRDISISRIVDPVGRRRCRGTPSTSSTSGTTPSSTTPPPSATAATPSASPTGGPRSTTSSARTSCASTASTGRPCCWPPGSTPPKRISVHGFLLVGGEKMSKTSLNQIAPADLVADFGVDGYRYHFLRRHPLRARRRLQLRGHGRALQQRPGQQPGQPPGPGGHRRRQEVRRRGSRARARTARWPRWPPRSYADTAAAWERVQPSLALEATWRLIRETNAHLEDQRAVEGRARPRGRRRARRRPRGAAHRDDPGLAGRSRHLCGDLAPARASRGGPRTSACPTPRRGAATPAVCPSRRATRSSPA